MVKISCTQALDTPKKILLKTGLWPTSTITICGKTKLIFNLIFDFVLLTIISLNIKKAVESNDIKHLNWTTCVLISMVNYSAKSLTLFANKKCFLSLLGDLDSEIFNSCNKRLNKHVKLIYKFSKLLTRYFAITLSSYVTIACFLPIIIDIPMTLPPPFETGRFDILYRILHFFAMAHLSVNTTGFDILLLTLMGLCVAQLNILKERLKYVLEISQKPTANTENRKLIIERNIRESIILHELIIQFVKKLGVLLSFPLFIQYTCGCFIICNTILQMTIVSEADSTNTVGICTYSCITFGQMTAYHWIGNEIIFQSNKIIESCYTSIWYELDIKSQKFILLLMERAKRPLIVELYGFVFISLDSLGVIVKWAYSLFALIKARYS